VKLQHPTNQILVSIICSLQQNKQSIGVFIPHMGNAPPGSNFAMIFEDRREWACNLWNVKCQFNAMISYFAKWDAIWCWTLRSLSFFFEIQSILHKQKCASFDAIWNIMFLYFQVLISHCCFMDEMHSFNRIGEPTPWGGGEGGQRRSPKMCDWINNLNI
jgi:hypothetical protein